MQETSPSWTAAIARIAGERESRRELLWLRAMEKGDAIDAKRLLGVDPSIPARLRFLHDVDFGALDALAPRRRRDAYAALYDFHLDWLVGHASSEDVRVERRRLARALTGP